MKSSRITFVRIYPMHFILLIATFLSLVPTIYMIDISLRNSTNSYLPTLISPTHTTANFAAIFTYGSIAKFFINSVIVAAGSVLVTICSATFLAFAVFRLHIKYAHVILFIVLSALALPLASILIPITSLLKAFALTNSYGGLIGPISAIGIPFSTMIIGAAMADVPPAVEEAAIMDGARSFRILTQILLPLVWPSVLVASVWQFLFSWNEFFLSLVIMTDNSMKTLPLAPLYFEGPYMTAPGKLFAVLTLIAITPMLFYILVQRWFVDGLMSGGIKG